MDEAIAHYKKALKIRPGYIEAMTNMAIALLQKGQIADAIPMLEHILRSDPRVGFTTPILLQTLSEAYARVGRFKEALEIAKSLVPEKSTFR